jgi:hypothetical protein
VHGLAGAHHLLARGAPDGVAVVIDEPAVEPQGERVELVGASVEPRDPGAVCPQGGGQRQHQGPEELAPGLAGRSLQDKLERLVLFEALQRMLQATLSAGPV